MKHVEITKQGKVRRRSKTLIGYITALTATLVALHEFSDEFQALTGIDLKPYYQALFNFIERLL